MPGPMNTQEIRTFLDSRPGWITLTTQSRDGYPHSVPIGYFRLGDEVFMGCRADTQKTKNIERNPKVSLSLESGSSMRDIKGVLVQGDATIVTEPVRLLELQREAGRQRGTAEEDLPTSVNPGTAYIAVKPVKVISWDYGKG
jgi:nitroimidazol reductase NimA-like FMN-containing flavoprotein (pyridoxamine 5'-phosphate oxidase superfamily)